jgi:hypothetical protein
LASINPPAKFTNKESPLTLSLKALAGKAHATTIELTTRKVFTA